jgi:putative ABC transport system permease protein
MKWLESTVQDLRFGLRGWAKTPGFAVAAVATLALGIGANTAVFSVISGVLLRPLPYADPDRLVQVNEIQPRSASGVETVGPVWPDDFLEFRAHSRLFEGFVTGMKTAPQALVEPSRIVSHPPKPITASASQKAQASMERPPGSTSQTLP